MTPIDEETDRKFRQALQPLSADSDPSVLNDPIAMLTKWEAQAPGAAAFRTHKRAKRHSHGMEFRSTFRVTGKPRKERKTFRLPTSHGLSRSQTMPRRWAVSGRGNTATIET